MNDSMRALPSKERLMRTTFWVLWSPLTALIAYGLMVEFSGRVLFFPFYPSAEEGMIDALSGFLGCCLFVATVAIGHWSRRLQRLGLVTLSFWLVYVTLPRF